MEYSRTKRPR